MNNHKEHIGDDMLMLYLTGELSASESLFVETWIDENIENRKYFEDFEKTWKYTSLVYPKQKVDTDLAWSKLDSKIDEKNQSLSNNPHSKKPFSLYKVAAVLLIPIAIYSWFTLVNKSASPQVISALQEAKDHSLTDGSLVSLNAGSEISFSEDFNESNRTVSLQGEAFFDVKRDEKKPFVIEGSLGSIQVLGTSFNVEARVNEDMKVFVKSGLVKLFRLHNRDTVFTLLRAGEGGIIKQNSFEIVRLSEPEPDALFWLSKKLNFKATPLKQVFKTLTKHYNIDFVFDEDVVQNCKLTAEFENDQIETILDVISATFSFQMELDNPNQFRVLGKKMGCLDAEI
jgi:ferric-dicitrate binding protein FerR (iron transport regulator)